MILPMKTFNRDSLDFIYFCSGNVNFYTLFSHLKRSLIFLSINPSIFQIIGEKKRIIQVEIRLCFAIDQPCNFGEIISHLCKPKFPQRCGKERLYSGETVCKLGEWRPPGENKRRLH